DARRIAAGGNRPFLLNDPEAVWLVESGSINVFAVSAENNEAVGSRHYLFHADANQILLGMALDGRNIGLLAAAAPGTELLQFNQNLLRQLAKNADYSEIIATLVSGWVECFSSGLSEKIPPRHYIALDKECVVGLPAKTLARPKKGVM